MTTKRQLLFLVLLANQGCAASIVRYDLSPKVASGASVQIRQIDGQIEEVNSGVRIYTVDGKSLDIEEYLSTAPSERTAIKSLQRFESTECTRGTSRRGIAIGAVGGVLLGGFTGNYFNQPSESQFELDGLKSTALGSSIGALLGGILGGFVGASVAADRDLCQYRVEFF
ncbi:MAG: hypothetical protein AAFU77_08085 [Myxococcota bacterium]